MPDATRRIRARIPKVILRTQISLPLIGVSLQHENPEKEGYENDEVQYFLLPAL
jgi:hypothetical protein